MSYFNRFVSFGSLLCALGLGAAPATAQTVRWITPPPVAVQGGEQIIVQWEVVGFDAPLVENAVAWGAPPWASTDDGRPPEVIARLLLKHGQRSMDQLEGNCAYTEVITVPVVPASETVYFTVGASTGDALTFEDARPVLLTVDPAAATYFPDAPGGAWVYQEPGSFGSFTVVTSPGVEKVGCAGTRVLEDVLSGVREQFTATADGVFLHRVLDFIPTFGERTIVYDPPLRLTNAELTVGDVATSSGTWTGILGGSFVIVENYTAEVTVAAVEHVFVPAGAFHATRLFLVLRFSGVVVDVATIWVAPGVGIVKAEANVGHGNRVLLGTNLP